MTPTHYVRLDGRVLLEFDADRRVTHEVASRNAYFHLLPHLRRYRYPEIVR